MEPLERTAVLLTLMRELQGVMQRENALLRTVQLARWQDLQEEKSALAEAYEMEVGALRRTPELVAALSPEVRSDLEQGMRNLRRAMRVNAECLMSGSRIVQGVLRHIGQSLESGSGRETRYRCSRTGAGTGPAKVIPMTLDRQV
jgi:hypothetical protein